VWCCGWDGMGNTGRTRGHGRGEGSNPIGQVRSGAEAEQSRAGEGNNSTPLHER